MITFFIGMLMGLFVPLEEEDIEKLSIATKSAMILLSVGWIFVSMILILAIGDDIENS